MRPRVRATIRRSDACLRLAGVAALFGARAAALAAHRRGRCGDGRSGLDPGHASRASRRIPARPGRHCTSVGARAVARTRRDRSPRRPRRVAVPARARGDPRGPVPRRARGALAAVALERRERAVPGRRLGNELHGRRLGARRSGDRRPLLAGRNPSASVWRASPRRRGSRHRAARRGLVSSRR